MHKIGAQFCVCIFLDSRDKSLDMFQNVSGFSKTKFQWIPRTNTCNVHFVATSVLLRIPQQGKVAGYSRFRIFKWIPQNVSGIRKM